MQDEEVGVRFDGGVDGATREIHRCRDPAYRAAVIELQSVEGPGIVREAARRQLVIEPAGELAGGGHRHDPFGKGRPGSILMEPAVMPALTESTALSADSGILDFSASLSSSRTASTFDPIATTRGLNVPA